MRDKSQDMLDWKLEVEFITFYGTSFGQVSVTGTREALRWQKSPWLRKARWESWCRWEGRQRYIYLSDWVFVSTTHVWLRGCMSWIDSNMWWHSMNEIRAKIMKKKHMDHDVGSWARSTRIQCSCVPAEPSAHPFKRHQVSENSPLLPASRTPWSYQTYLYPLLISIPWKQMCNVDAKRHNMRLPQNKIAMFTVDPSFSFILVSNASRTWIWSPSMMQRVNLPSLGVS